MRAGFGIDQLGVDPDPIARASDAALQHIAHPELAADLLGVHRFVLVGEGRIAGDHEYPEAPRQIGCQIVSDPISEILLPAIFA